MPLSNFSNIALAVGVDFGFNAVGVESWIDSDTFEGRIVITFWSCDELRKPRLRPPSEWALSWTDEKPCVRNKRMIEMSHSALCEPVKELTARFTEALLELAA